MDFKLINVGIADIKISESPNVLRTILGSCIGICIYDKTTKIGGMAHIMLPRLRNSKTNHLKYADTAIPVLITEMLDKGAKKEKLVAKIIGGATMFDVSVNSIMGEIGKNNVEMVKTVLKENNIKIIAEDIGGDHGRTIDFHLKNGNVKIKSLSDKEKII